MAKRTKKISKKTISNFGSLIAILSASGSLGLISLDDIRAGLNLKRRRHAQRIFGRRAWLWQ